MFNYRRKTGCEETASWRDRTPEGNGKGDSRTGRAASDSADRLGSYARLEWEADGRTSCTK